MIWNSHSEAGKLGVEKKLTVRVNVVKACYNGRKSRFALPDSRFSQSDTKER